MGESRTGSHFAALAVELNDRARVLKSRIFISYRRDDSAGWANHLYCDLVELFGKEQIFRDLDMTLGRDFRKQLGDALDSCAVLLVVIGPRWLIAQDDDGRRRLDDPKDFVHLEVATVLERDIDVIPLLVEEAKMPSKDQLPEPLENLAWHFALELSDDRWEYDVGRLTDALTVLLDSCGEEAAEQTSSGTPADPAPSKAETTTGSRAEDLAQLEEWIAIGSNVVISGRPGIGKTRLLSALCAARSEAIWVGLAGGAAMRDLRLALHPHCGGAAFLRDDHQGIAVIQRSLPADALLLFHHADAPESAAAVLRLVDFMPNATVVVTSRGQNFPGFERLKLVALSKDEAEALVADLGLDDTGRDRVLKLAKGNPQLLIQGAEAVRRGGDLDVDDMLGPVLERLSADEQRVLWLIAELPSPTLAMALLVEVGRLTEAGLARLRSNAVIERVASGYEVHPTLRVACEQRLQALPHEQVGALRADAAAYYIGFLKGGPDIDHVNVGAPEPGAPASYS